MGVPSALRLRGGCGCGRRLFFKPCNGVQNGPRHGVRPALLQKAFASVHGGKGPGGAFEQAARLQSDGGSAFCRQGPARPF